MKQPRLLRSLLLFAALLLLIAVVSSAVAPRDATNSKPTTTRPPAANPPQRTNVRTIDWSLPTGADTQRARVGDVIQLTVSSPAGDLAELPALGLDVPVDDGAPGELRFVADQVGRFAVVLRYSGERLGTLVVAAAAKQPGPGPPTPGAAPPELQPA